MFNMIYNVEDGFEDRGNSSVRVCKVTIECSGISLSETFDVTTPTETHVLFEGHFVDTNTGRDKELELVQDRLRYRLESILKACIKGGVDL